MMIWRLHKTLEVFRIPFTSIIFAEYIQTMNGLNTTPMEGTLKDSLRMILPIYQIIKFSSQQYSNKLTTIYLS